MDSVEIARGLDHFMEAKMIRQLVFVEEQKFENEFDAMDDTAYHVLIRRDGKAVATGRAYRKEGEPNTYVLGRIAVLKAFRSQHLGALVVGQLEKEIRKHGAERALLSAQVRVQGFYEKLGYQRMGDVFMDEHIPHRWMQKQLK